ncbi:MAG: bifunctional serine/threonine-protein kinase/formylglycine-generating enzyme family protein [Casimicrobiaceae bacterium]
MRERFGEGVDPCISLEPEGGGAPASDYSSEVLKRLADRPDASTRYKLQGELAQGGMGAILRVWDEDLRRHLAMKVILGKVAPARAADEGDADQATPSFGDSTTPIPARTVGRFLEEAQVTGQLDHPGIVPVHELGLDQGGRVYFTMKLVKGEDLKAVFARVHAGEPGWTTTRVISLLQRACEALAYAHSKHVIHRDLKPANIMIGKYGEVYVMDWGLARVLDRPDGRDLRLRPEHEPLTTELRSERHAPGSGSDDAESPLVTMNGDIVGTPAYMPPEQARGELERLGPGADVYALGALLYHLLSGRIPYVVPGAYASPHAILARVQAGPPQPLHELAPDVPVELAAICERAMAREPEQRYADMSMLADDLRAYIEHRVVTAYETGAVAELKKWVVRNKPLAAALAAVLLLALTAGVVFASMAKQARRERDNVFRLSASQELDTLRSEADSLWPATPDQVPACDAWLARAARLVASLEPSTDGQDSGHRRELLLLRERALPRTDASLEAERQRHPRLQELDGIERRLASLRMAQAVRSGAAAPTDYSLEAADLVLDETTADELAWTLVDPDRTAFGREAEGLALARWAAAQSDESNRSAFSNTLAWALFANGLDLQALATSAAALAAAPEDKADLYRDYLASLKEAVRFAEAPGALESIEADHASLEAIVSERQTWLFSDAEDAWQYNLLTELIAKIEAFADPHTGLIGGISPSLGWGIGKRREFAATVEQRTLKSEDARRRWAAAMASIADRTQCPAYDGLNLTPQLGLLPIGRDRSSGLWEFWHVQSGDEPLRGPDGMLVLTESSGLVLVLVPSGRFWMGAQSADRTSQNYDHDASLDEAPVHDVTLAAYFISKYEMTQGQWAAFAGQNPSQFVPGTINGGHTTTARHPVEQMSWDDAMRVMRRMSLDLPTEAQWERGARGNTSTPWWTGAARDTLMDPLAANLADQSAAHAGASWTDIKDWIQLNDGWVVHAPVESFAPNRFGLHGVCGNVWEWCKDGYGEYSAASQRDPIGTFSGDRGYVNRGGSFNEGSAYARSASRASRMPVYLNGNLGLRPARRIDP